MKLHELIALVDKHYDDGLIDAYYDHENQRARNDSDLGDRLAQFIVTEICETFEEGAADSDLGDRLAQFIVTEICETFEEGAADSDQLREAIRVMEVAQDQLHSVIRGLEDHLP